MSYFFDYALHWRTPSNSKADKGNVVHKAMEIMARRKLAIQNGQEIVCDEELWGKSKIPIGDITRRSAHDWAWQHVYEKPVPGQYKYINGKKIQKNNGEYHRWDDKDNRECWKWFNMCLDYNKGTYDPMNQDIVQAELYFDFKMDKVWSDDLYIKGTVDLVIKHEDDVYEIVDYKTGERKDWATGKNKELEDLYDDPQLLLYHYAIRRMFPHLRQVIFTIFFIRSGGPYSICFEDSDLEKAEILIRNRYLAIKSCQSPQTIYPHPFKCSKICWHGKHNDKNEIVQHYNQSACATIKKEIQQIGLERVFEKYKRESGYTGGGRTEEAAAKEKEKLVST